MTAATDVCSCRVGRGIERHDLDERIAEPVSDLSEFATYLVAVPLPEDVVALSDSSARIAPLESSTPP